VQNIEKTHWRLFLGNSPPRPVPSACVGKRLSRNSTRFSNRNRLFDSTRSQGQASHIYTIISEHEKTRFNPADWQMFFTMLDNPPEPTERMKTAALTHQKIIAAE
jgi:Protein of unknown function (DUF1778)